MTHNIDDVAESLRADDDLKTIKGCYRWVQKNLRYDVLDSLNPVSSYDPQDTVSRGSGNCIAIAAVFMSLLRKNGIACRFRLLHIRPTSSSLALKVILCGRTDFPHGVVDVRVNDKWITMLPLKGLRFSPGKGQTVLDLKNESNSPKFLLIKDYGTYDDVPPEEVEALGARLHPHLHGKGRILRWGLARILTNPRGKHPN